MNRSVTQQEKAGFFGFPRNLGLPPTIAIEAHELGMFLF